MVKISGFKHRQTGDGKQFIVLELEGGIQIQTSMTTGNPYASVARTTMPCTFDEQTVKEMIGTTIPGTIIKEDCEPYSFYNQTTNEEVTLNSRYVYKGHEMASNEHTPLILTSSKEIDVL